MKDEHIVAQMYVVGALITLQNGSLSVTNIFLIIMGIAWFVSGILGEKKK